MIFNRVDKKGNLFLLSFILSLFFLTLVSAVPPVQSTAVVSNRGIQIEAPIIETRETLQDFEFHIHAHNATDGLVLTNATITYCTIHLYNNVGNHIIEANMTFDLNGLDWEYDVLGANFTREGYYAVLFYCEVSEQGTKIIGGFLEYPIKVTPTGFADTYGFYIIILLISSILIIWGYSIKDSWIIIFGTFGLYFTGIYVLLNGLVGIKDMVTTWAIGIILLGVASYISVRAAIEVING